MAEAAATADTTATTTAADTSSASATTTAAGATAAATTTTASTTATTAATTTKGTDKTATVTAGKTSDTTVTKGYWPEDWQKKFAGEDEKELKQVSRYATPEEVWKKARALERRLSSGELRPALPKDAKPEEIAAWRKDVGIPETPEKYDLKFDSGLVIGKEDQPIINEFLKSAHASHFTPEQAKSAVQWFFQDRERQIQELAAKDDDDRVATLDTLNQEFGGQFRRNINMVEGVLSKFPEKAREALKSARLPDGTAAFNNPDVIRGFVALALEVNPAGIVVPAGGGDLGKTALDEYKGIQKLMREDRKSYDKDAGKQQRFRELADFLVKHEVIDQNGNEIVQKKKAA